MYDALLLKSLIYFDDVDNSDWSDSDKEFRFEMGQY